MHYPVLTPAQLSLHLRSLRKAKHLTQAEVAAQLGITQSRLGKIERHPERTNFAQLMRLLGVLGARITLSAGESTPAKQEAALPTDW
jgi:HTH-type transcriptional regulator/antitoxin HipB